LTHTVVLEQLVNLLFVFVFACVSCFSAIIFVELKPFIKNYIPKSHMTLFLRFHENTRTD